jgi:hypothetical protein
MGLAETMVGRLLDDQEEPIPATQPSRGDDWPPMPCSCHATTVLYRERDKSRYWEICSHCGAERDLPASLWRRHA